MWHHNRPVIWLVQGILISPELIWLFPLLMQWTAPTNAIAMCQGAVQMMGVFAEFERAMIQERVHAGLARARKEGKRLGRPRVSPETEKAILEARKQGTGINRIAAELGVGSSTVRRVIAESEK
jgi:hypothetical protein